MAKPTTHSFGEFLIEIESDDSPGVYLAPCGLTTKGFNQTASTQETTVPDCDNPDAPAYVERAVDTISTEISGSGVLAEEAFDIWQAWFDSARAKSVRIYPMGASNGFYGGQFILSAFNMQVQRGQKVPVDVTMVSDGQTIWNGPGSP
jgi:hypothetical protein